jgi:hypothetical protein
MDARLMDWIDRVNRYFLNMIGKRQARTTSGAASLHLSPGLIKQLVRLDLASHD